MGDALFPDTDEIEEQGRVNTSADKAEVRRALRVCAGFLFLCGIVWLAAFWADQHLLYIKPGSEIMSAAKVEYARTGTLFDMSKNVRVLVIGNSKIMSGFLPAQFERDVPQSSAYNYGKPQVQSMDELAVILRRGQIPTHVLFAVDWRDVAVPSRSVFHPIVSDQVLIDELFPFRHLIRNGMVFLMRSHSFGGIRNFYHLGQESVAQMNRDQGYFFIAEQSRFPGHRLPANFRLDSDDPASVIYRQPNLSSHSFQQLHDLSLKYGFKVLVIPYYRRNGESGSPGVNKGLVSALQPYDNFKVLGDEYYLFDNSYFSDLMHLNLEGAEMYTGLLTGLVRQELAQERGVNAF